MARKSTVKGANELLGLFGELERLPQTVSTKAARAGGIIVQRASKRNAPVDEGNLKRGIIIKREKSKVKGKAVYQVTFDARMNEHFVKVSKDGKRSYYPASQEFGWMLPDGRYIPGYRYMRKSADEESATVEKKILEVTGTEVDKILNKGRRGR